MTDSDDKSKTTKARTPKPKTDESSAVKSTKPRASRTKAKTETETVGTKSIKPKTTRTRAKTETSDSESTKPKTTRTRAKKTIDQQLSDIYVKFVAEFSRIEKEINDNGLNLEKLGKMLESRVDGKDIFEFYRLNHEGKTIRDKQKEGIERRRQKNLFIGRQPIAKSVEEQIIELTKSGLRIVDIERRLNLSRSTVIRYQKKNNIYMIDFSNKETE